MRQDWIEFKMKAGRKVSLRPKYIVSVFEKEGNVWLSYDENPFVDGDQKLVSFHQVAEPYEQVKQKIMDAEKVDLSDAVVEHFTREEYNTLYDLVVEESEHGIGETYLAKLTPIKNKLNEILKEGRIR